MSTTLAPPELCVTTVRTLSMDAVQKANSGHPGGPMGLAPIAWTIFTRHMRHAPHDPEWPNRDRFVLSNGHASMLLYSLLHLTGYDLPLTELERFRQLESMTPGHPERGDTPGVEITTGPLGQGISNAVGFALAEAMLAARYNREGHDVVDHRTWFICSDGDLMEGISHEAASFAGHLQLGKLVGVYDDNHISLDGPTDLSFNEDVPARFAAYGWRVLHIRDANDLDEIDSVLTEASESDGRPTLICARTHIGWGSPNKQDTSSAHGSPLGPDEVAATKKAYGWPTEPDFLIPPEVELWKAEMADRGRRHVEEWDTVLEGYRAQFPDLAEQLVRTSDHRLPDGWREALPEFGADDVIASRKAGGTVLNALAERIPEIVQGAADLSTSTGTDLKGMGRVQASDMSGRNIYFGVREHAMGAITNGISAHGGLRPVCSTFFQFYDYMKNTVRLAALMRLSSIFVYTHDSIGLGEDGPTHQPVEHLAAARAVPNLVTLRPADANETAAAWAVAVARTHGPTMLILSRQNLTPLGGPNLVEKGAYVIADGDDAILIGTGSEVATALAARELLLKDGITARVVSMPSFELFRAQSDEYRESVLPSSITRRVAVEAASALGWHEWVGLDGAVVALDRFGASAPAAEVYAHLGITPEAVADAARRLS